LTKAIEVAFYDGQSARRQPARLDFADGAWRVAGDFGTHRLPHAQARISEPLGQASRTLSWPDGAHCEIDDLDGFAALLAQAGGRASPVVAMQSRWIWAVAAVVGLVATLAFGYVVVLPWGAEQVARRIPDSAVRSLSAEILQSLDKHVLEPSAVEPARQQALRERLAALLPGPDRVATERIHFRRSKRLPPNAFALPSGDIVVFDSLVELAGSDDEVLAVLAHETGHVASRHGIRQMLQSAVVSTAVAVYLGDVSSLASGVGTLLLESRYSREFEREADRFAADTLMTAGLSPELLATMLEKLEASRRAGGGETQRESGRPVGVDLLSTHPETAERVAALRALAGR
jgi:Zn-dependent protease with chaperone function